MFQSEKIQHLGIASIVTVLLLLLIPFVTNVPTSVTSQAAPPTNPPRKIYGWMWSAATQKFGGKGGIGWIKLNSCNINVSTGLETGCDTGAQYGVQVASDGTLSGFGWSPHYGWVDFSGAGCGAGGAAKVVGSTIKDSTDKAWFRFTSVINQPTTKTGGWNGCVNFYSAAFPTYKITVTNVGAGIDKLDGWGWSALSAIGSVFGNRVGGTGWVQLRDVYMVTQSGGAQADLALHGWNGACSATSTYNIGWVTSNVQTGCSLSGPGLPSNPYPIPSSQQAAGFVTVSGVTPNNYSYILTCDNTSTSVAVTDSVIVSCSQCSDGVDNDSKEGIDQADKSCHEQCDLTKPHIPWFDNEGFVCPLTPPTGCPPSCPTVPGGTGTSVPIYLER